jgi:conjugative transposon TraN protein
MKKIINFLPFIGGFLFCFFSISVYAQDAYQPAPAQAIPEERYKVSPLYNGSTIGIDQKNVVKITIPLNATTHFVSPEPIDYVDISTPTVQGDLSSDKVFRLRPVSDVLHSGDKFTVTVVTKSFIVVYELTAEKNTDKYDAVNVIKIDPNDGILLNQSDILSQQQCFDLATQTLKRGRNIHNVQASAYGIHMWLNGVYTYGDYILLDVGMKVNTKIPFTMKEMRFKLIDRKQMKATVSQEIELQPYYSLYPYQDTKFNGTFRNFFVFNKFTYPTAKFFNIAISETNNAGNDGRHLEMNISYNQILKALNLQ